jgi:hypothetical protein
MSKLAGFVKCVFLFVLYANVLIIRYKNGGKNTQRRIIVLHLSWWGRWRLPVGSKQGTDRKLIADLEDGRRQEESHPVGDHCNTHTV